MASTQTPARVAAPARNAGLTFVAAPTYTGVNVADDGDPHVQSVSATFDTTTNDKDHDTYLDVAVYNNGGVLIADKTGIGGHWNDHTTNVVSLDLKNALSKPDVPAGAVRLDIHPNGNDKWEFNYHIDITWSDNSVTEKRWDGKVLTQDNSSTTDVWNGY